MIFAYQYKTVHLINKIIIKNLPTRKHHHVILTDEQTYPCAFHTSFFIFHFHWFGQTVCAGCYLYNSYSHCWPWWHFCNFLIQLSISTTAIYKRIIFLRQLRYFVYCFSMFALAKVTKRYQIKSKSTKCWRLRKFQNLELNL